MPPSYTKYIAWGFADHSLRVGLYDTDRASFVSEAAAQNSGEILTCACPNSKMIITAGTSSVITVWKFDANRKSLTVRHSLHGHTDAVTCLAASAAYNVIVSGSRDGTAIVWDMARFTFVRQLRGHVGVVAAVAINELTGDIATCSATWLHVWSINGDPLATVNTCVGSADRMQQILCVAFSQIREWDQQNVVITGSTDGVVRVGFCISCLNKMLAKLLSIFSRCGLWNMFKFRLNVNSKDVPKLNHKKIPILIPIKKRRIVKILIVRRKLI